MADNTELKTIFTADSKQFIAESLKMEARVKKLAGSIEKEYGVSFKKAEQLAKGSITNTNKLLAEQSAISRKFALGITAALGIAGKAYESTYEKLDDLFTVTEKLNIPVSQFQALQYAAQRADVDVSTLEDGLLKLRKSLGDSTKVEAFKNLGLDQAKLAAEDLGVAYQEVAAAIATIESPTAQAAAAIDLLGKGGQESLNLLRSDIKATTNEYASFGVALTELDKEAFGKLDERFDQFTTKLKDGVLKGVASLTPVVLSLIDVIDKLGTSLGKAAGATSLFVQSAGQGISTSINDAIFARSDRRQAGASGFVTRGISGAQDEASTFINDRIDNVKNFFSTIDRANTALVQFKTGSGASSIPNLGINSTSTGHSIIPSIGTLKEKFDVLAKASQVASDKLSNITDNKSAANNDINNILGISSPSGASYAQSILQPVQQVQDAQFTALLTQFRNQQIRGKDFGETNQATTIEQLQRIADQYNNVGDGFSNSGMLAVIKELRTALEKRDGRQEVKVLISVDKEGIITAVTENEKFGGAVISIAEKAADNAARAATR